MLHHQNRHSSALASRFSMLHPASMLAFFAVTILITLISYHPVVLGLSLVIAALTLASYQGLARLARAAMWVVPMAAVVIAFNTVLNHRGSTPLASTDIFSRSYTLTLESLYFGISVALMLAAIILWASVFQHFMTNDRLLFLLSPVAPTLGLSTTMVLRWVPLTHQRWTAIRNAEKMMPAATASTSSTPAHTTPTSATFTTSTATASGITHKAEKTPRKRRLAINGFARSLSTLMSWSIEDAIMGADSMQARGYLQHKPGEKRPRRSSFRSYFFGKTDAFIMAVLLITGSAAIITIFASTHALDFFPDFQGLGSISIPALILAAAIMLTPLLLESSMAMRRGLQWVNHKYAR